MYFSSDGVTQQVHMIFGVLVKRINFHSRKLRKKAPKSFENPLKIDVWGSLGTISEPLDKHLGHMLPKNSILEAFGSVLGAQDGQFGSNLEAQDPPKSLQEHEKGQKMTCFWHRFFRCSSFILKGFLDDLFKENIRKL